MIRPEEPQEPPLHELEALAREHEPPLALEERVAAELRRQSLLRRASKRWRQMAAAVFLVASGIAVGRLSAPSGVVPATTQPRFLLLLSQAPPAESESGRVAEYRAWAVGLRTAGRQISGERLEREALAVDRDRAAERVDDRNQGYFIVSAANLEEAAELARSSPHVRAGGHIIVRPIAGQ
jgi:hypothetical protein